MIVTGGRDLLVTAASPVAGAKVKIVLSHMIGPPENHQPCEDRLQHRAGSLHKTADSGPLRVNSHSAGIPDVGRQEVVPPQWPHTFLVNRSTVALGGRRKISEMGLQHCSISCN